jgi:putative glutamine amidotransferase
MNVSAPARPIVAVSSCRVVTEYDGRREPIVGSNVAYTRAVLAAGGAPVLLPYGVDVTVADAVLSGAHALLLTGGDDVVGACPSDSADRRAYEDPVRDLTDRALLAAARSRGMPVLGVCRGMQLLAVASHGSLARVRDHVPPSGSDALRHEVLLEPDGPLAALLGVAVAEVSSLHRYAVADPGLLRVAGRARDGVIEAIVGTDPERFELGVQWHPELDAGPLGPPVVRLLVAAAARFATEAAAVPPRRRAALVGSR